jgi:carboxymethylenebutenolidase
MRSILVIVAMLLLVGCAKEASDTAGQPSGNKDTTSPSGDLHINESPVSANVSNAGAMTAGDLAIKTSSIQYYGNVTGFLAEPQAPGSYPGVVLIHEWWGLNDQIKQSAQVLASHGYRVLAVDLYNGKVATQPSDAQKLVGTVTPATSVPNMRAAANYLRSSGSASIGSYGWCFGGGQSLQLALSEEPLDAVVIYYGQLVTEPQKLSSIDAPVLGIFGAQDQSISVSQVQQFNASLSQADVEHDVIIYEGVGHAFANPSGMNYAPVQTADAWNRTLVFLNENLK